MPNLYQLRVSNLGTRLMVPRSHLIIGKIVEKLSCVATTEGRSIRPELV